MPVPTYWDYLSLDRLLTLQDGLGGPAAPSADELHFIIVHQAYELWFKLVLSQLRLARDHLDAPVVPEEHVPFVVHHLGRVNEILKLCVEQFRVMETLPPQDFLDFRDKLTPSSGFQSFQMREIEILLGLEESQRIRYGETDPLRHIAMLAEGSPAGALAWGRITQARSEVTLRAALLRWLARTPIQGSAHDAAGDDAAVDGFLNAYLQRVEAHQRDVARGLIGVLGGAEKDHVEARVAAGVEGTRAFLLPEDRLERRARAALLFIESYRQLPLLAWPRLLLDTVVEVEEQMLLFRNRHARMVERTIGRRVGTGGSAGVDYLDKTTTYRIFPELWAVRTALLPRDYLPALEHPERYGFHAPGTQA
jgi:tryptophan 2,3-dioxygenase